MYTYVYIYIPRSPKFACLASRRDSRCLYDKGVGKSTELYDIYTHIYISSMLYIVVAANRS